MQDPKPCDQTEVLGAWKVNLGKGIQYDGWFKTTTVSYITLFPMLYYYMVLLCQVFEGAFVVIFSIRNICGPISAHIGTGTGTGTGTDKERFSSTRIVLSSTST